MDGVHAQSLADRQKDGGKDQAGRGHIHKGANHQQDDVNEEQDHIPVAADGKQGAGHQGRDVGERHDPRHDAGHADQEDDDAGHLGTFAQNLGDFFQFDGFIAKQGEQQAVYNGHNGTFGCGEHTADDAADDNDNEQQRRDGLQDGVDSLLKGEGSLAAVAVLFGNEVDHDHAGQAPQDTGQVAGHEQCGNRSTAGHQREGDHNVAGRDQQAGRGGGNVGGSGEVGVIAFFFFDGADDGTHGGSSSRTGTGDCAKQHVGNHVGLCQSAGGAAGDELGQVDQADRNAAFVHNIAGQDKERDGQQAEHGNTGENALRAGNNGDFKVHNGQDGNHGRNAERHCDGHACDQHNDQQDQDDQPGNKSNVHCVFLLILRWWSCVLPRCRWQGQ